MRWLDSWVSFPAPTCKAHASGSNASWIMACCGSAHGRPAQPLPRDAGLLHYARTARQEDPREEKSAALLHPAPRRTPPALRLPPRARGRAEELGGTEGPEP